MNKNRRWSKLAADKAGLGLVALALLLLVGLAAAGYMWIRGPGHRFQLGLDALARQDLAAVRREAARLESSGHVAHASVLQGASLLRAGQPQQALEPLAKASDASDLTAIVNTLGGEALLQLEQPQGAALALTRAIEADPNQPDARRFLGALSYGDGDIKEAMTQLEQAAALAPRNPGPCSLLGHIAQEQEEHEQAIRWYQESLRRGPAQADRDAIVRELAVSLIQLGRYAEARGHLAQCESTTAAYGLMAECFREEGRREQAHLAVDQALILSPFDDRSLMFKGRLALEDEDGATALEMFARVVQLHPENPSAHQQLAQAYRLLGDTDRADEEDRVATGLQHDWARFTELGHLAQQEADNVEVRLQLGALAKRLNLQEFASRCFTAVLTLDPGNEVAQAELAAMSAEADPHAPHETSEVKPRGPDARRTPSDTTRDAPAASGSPREQTPDAEAGSPTATPSESAPESSPPTPDDVP